MFESKRPLIVIVARCTL